MRGQVKQQRHKHGQVKQQQKTTSDQVATVEWSEYSGVFSRLRNAVDVVRTSNGDDNLLEDIDQDISFLSEEWSDNFTDQRSLPAFKNSLEMDSALLGEIQSNHLTGDQAKKAIHNVRDDLHIKAENCKASHGLGHNGWDSLINLSVITKHGDIPVSGYEVWIVQAGWDNHPEKWTRSSTLSSPALFKKLAPGLYMIKAKKEAVTEAEPMPVGGHSESQQTWDVIVP
jgi:hypothetical protein